MMPRTFDPLLFLRENIQLNKRIYREQDYLVFEDGIRLKLDTPTALVQSQTNKQYTIGSLWFYLIHRNETLTFYIKECQKVKIEGVLGLDKNLIVDYFINNINKIELINDELRPKTLIFIGKKRKGTSFVETYTSELNPSETAKNGSQEGVASSSLKKNDKGELISQTQSNRVKWEKLEPNLMIMHYIYTNEKKSLNRNSMLKPMDNLQSFESLLGYCKNIFTKEGKIQKQNEIVSFWDELVSTDDLRGNKAIIVVPSSYVEGNLVYENAKEFLENANYINIKTTADNEKELLVTEANKNSFSKTINGKNLMFDISSNVRNFSRNDWKRVVAVFVQGDEWEFKDWPKSENVATILQKVKGFHLKYQDLPWNENVRKWNVKILEISRTKRHFDVSIQDEFWRIWAEFLAHPRNR